MVGPWDHEGSGEHTDHAVCVPVPPTAAHRWDAYQAFFDRYVMQAADAAPVPAVEVFTLNDDWQRPRRVAAVRPRRRRPTTCARAALLSTEPPAADEEPDAYDYDPANPVAETLGGNCWMLCEALGDRREIEQRPDVVSYATPPLAADLELTGPITAVLYAATSAVDTDFTIAVVDVFEDGTANQIQDGIVRARFRNGMDAPSLVEPGEVVRYEIDLFATSYLLRRGHRLQVDVSSSCFDRYDRNPNTGGDYGHAADPVVAHQVDPPRAGACRRTSCCRSWHAPPEPRRNDESPHFARFASACALRPGGQVPYVLLAPSAEQLSAAAPGTANGPFGGRERYARRRRKGGHRLGASLCGRRRRGLPRSGRRDARAPRRARGRRGSRPAGPD